MSSFNIILFLINHAITLTWLATMMYLKLDDKDQIMNLYISPAFAAFLLVVGCFLLFIWKLRYKIPNRVLLGQGCFVFSNAVLIASYSPIIDAL